MPAPQSTPQLHLRNKLPKYDSHQQKRTVSSDIIQNSLDEVKVVTMPLVLAIIVAAASQFNVGCAISVMNSPEKVVYPGHSTFVWSLAVAAFAIGGPFGAVIGGKLADQRGRRGALLIDIWIFLFGGILQTMAPGMFTIVLARFIVGFASGFSSVLVPIYLGEIAPLTLKGMLGTVTQLALVTGILASDILAFWFATESMWRILFAVAPILSMIQLILAPFLLESPRWLLNRNPESLNARDIIMRLRGLRYDHDLETEVGNFLRGGDDAHRQQETSQLAVLREMWNMPKIRSLLLASLFLQVAQQLCGINAVFYYSTIFFEGVIDDPLVGTTLVGAVNVAATLAVLFLMDRFGRRILILWSSGGMFLSCIAIVSSLRGYFSNIMAIVAVNSYVAFFEFGLGPIPWLIVAELFEGKYLAVAMSLSSQVNWACNFIVGLVFPYMNEVMGAYSFAPFAVVLALTFIFAATALPETQGTTPEELAVELTCTLGDAVKYKVVDDSATIVDLVEEEERGENNKPINVLV